MLKTSSKHYQAFPAFARFLLSERSAFGVALFAVLLALFCFRPPNKTGDFSEYGIMTVALASHGTPDIRLSDIEKARRLNPESTFTDFYRQLDSGIRKNEANPAPAFYRGKDGSYYALHFFAYSAIAALPFAVFDTLGIPPFKCYQFVNLAFIFILGLAAYRFFQSQRQAAAALVLFAFSGGLLYWEWCSPEAMTAASLLAGLMLSFSGAPLAAGVLAGIASMQNPPLVFFAGFAPLLVLVYQRRWPSRKDLAGLGIVVLLFACPILFNLGKFGVPSLLAAASTDTRLIGVGRLFSFFFDLNQGMIVGMPALMMALVLILVVGPGARGRLLAIGAALFSIALVLPALSTQNWNSGASGMMRYAFWMAMPILFACMLYARDHQVSRTLILALILAQAGASWMERQYSYVQFSRAAKFFLARFPSAYNPEFEIFSERLRNQEGSLPKNTVLYYTVNGKATKIAFNLENRQAGMAICGKNKALSLDAGVAPVDDGWVYLNNAPVCVPSLTEDAIYTAKDFAIGPLAGSAAVRFTQGWDKVEFGGANWDGIWSVAPVARIDITPPSNLPYQTLTIRGQYIVPDMETEVTVNGVRLGRYSLDRGLPIPVKSALRKDDGRTVVELRHVPGKNPIPAGADTRQLGFFVTKIVLH